MSSMEANESMIKTRLGERRDVRISRARCRKQCYLSSKTGKEKLPRKARSARMVKADMGLVFEGLDSRAPGLTKCC